MRGEIGTVCLAAVAALAGCSALRPQTLRIDSAAGMYHGVTLTYRVDGGQLSEPLTVARIAGHQVTQESLPSSPYPDQSVARLSIRYPHPDDKADYALAELVVETRAPPNVKAKKSTWQQMVDTVASTARDILPGVKLSDDVYEAWAMDISKTDLDRIIAGMSQSGYFVNPSKSSVGVELAAHIDSFQANKKWTREPELDLLMERIRQQGRLVSYVHPTDSSAALIAVAPAKTGPQLRLVSHDEAGPALMPAGPQNNAYTDPPEPSAATKTRPYTPPSPNAPAPYMPPPAPAGSLPPPASAPAVRQSKPRSSMSDSLRQPATMPPPTASPSSTPAPSKPKGRWQYPPQYRRSTAPPQTQSTPKQAAPITAAQGGTRNPPQQRQLRLPWRRPGAGDATQQPSAAPNANGLNNQNAGRTRVPRGPGAAGQQSPAGGRLTPRYPAQPGYPPQGAPAQPGPYSGYPQASAAPSAGPPAGMPQPPQLSPQPPLVGSRPATTY